MDQQSKLQEQITNMNTTIQQLQIQNKDATSQVNEKEKKIVAANFTVDSEAKSIGHLESKIKENESTSKMMKDQLREEIAQLKGKLDQDDRLVQKKTNSLTEMVAKNTQFEMQMKDLNKRLQVQEELKLLAQSDSPAANDNAKNVFAEFSKQELAEADKQVNDLKTEISNQQQKSDVQKQQISNEHQALLSTQE